ncbi:PHD finger domain-containing protein [Sporobolomyces koalae]|uniref:PHD finger domain-containing protein n=1 Tax=Sporobolomyces koalae TaxID=500713 RepID=UPI00317855EE
MSDAPAHPDEQQLLAEMRQSYKLAAASHFVGLYSHHLDLKHQVQELEQDLLPSREGHETYLPYMLGKLLNTLANDRNTNHTNWLNALRRSYNRRVTMRSDNPFYQYLVVPDSVVRSQLEAERLAKQGSNANDDDDDDEARRKGIFTESDEKLRLAEGKKPYKKKEKQEPSAADVNLSSGTTAEAQVPLTETAIDDGFNAEMADVIAEDAAQDAAVTQLEQRSNGNAKPEDEDEFWEEQRAVEWKDLSLETKIDAIYNVCEWHMVDPDKQFRKYLQFDGESAWRLDPIGLDRHQNYYYHLSDDRLWIQRPIPSVDEARALGCPEPPEPITKPKSLLGLRAGPRDKSKKGTITGTVRFKLKRDPKTGEFRQLREDEQDGGVSVGTGIGGSSTRVRDDDEKVFAARRKKHEDADEDFTDGHSNERGANRRQQDDEDDEDDVDEEDLFAELEESERIKKLEERAAIEKRKRDQKEDEQRELTEWEKQVWAERWRAEHTPGFIEWQAVCTDLDQWRQFAAKFEGSDDQDEQNVHQYALDWIPEYERILAAEAENKERELAAANSKRGTTRGARDATMETVARLAAEEAALNERFTRVTRGQLSALDESNSNGGAAGSKSAQPAGESREERLKKREDEKRAREEAEEQKVLEEAREREREEARERNGGVLPYELMNEQEKAAFDFEQEREAKRVQKEAEKKKREDIKRQRAKERRAELKAEKEAAEAELAEFEAEINPQDEVYAAPAQQYQHQVPVAAAPLNEEPPWYTDCEVCGRQGWNIDDGVETICCEQCEEWQHLPCHIQRDALEGRQPVNYADDAYKFYCIRCQHQPGRRPRPVPPAHELPPPPPPIMIPPPAPAPAPVPAANKRKAPVKAQPAAKKAKPQKAPTSGNGAMYGHGHHPLYHPSAYAHVSPQPVVQQPPPQPAPAAAAAAAPAAAQPQMTYEELSNRVQQDPRLLAQLPPAYQQHFSEKFGIPMPQ